MMNNILSAMKGNNDPTSQKARIEYIDLAKGFCIIFVVFHHFCLTDLGAGHPVIMFLRTFRMPLYFILSGLFFKEYSGLFDFTIRKINKLLVPFIFFLLISCLLFIIANHSPLMSTPKLLFQSVWNEDIYRNIPIWFLWCLFVNNILFYLIKISVNKLQKSYQIAAIILFCFFIGFIGWYIGTINVNLPMWIDTTFTTIPFFVFGYLLRKHTTILYPNSCDKYLMPISLACFAIVLIFENVPLFVYNDMSQCSFISLYLCGIAGTLGVLLLSKRIGTLPIISYYGRYSIIILCTHMLLRLILSKAGLHNHWLLLGVVLSSYVIVIPLVRQFLPYVTAQKDLFSPPEKAL